jgi:subtilase family serine protease
MTVDAAARAMTALHPKSVSPGSVRPAPMDFSVATPSWLAQAAPSRVRPDFPEGPLSWSELPGNVVQLVVSPDGTLWALAEGAGPNYPIVHYSSGAWASVPGSAKEIAISPNGNTLYAVNSGGGIWALNVASSSWSGIGGAASDITVALDSSLYVLSNAGSGGSYPVWHYVSGTWTALPGTGALLAASWDPNTYMLGASDVSPNGFYIVTVSGQIFYYSPAVSGYVSLPGTTHSLAPVVEGLFAIGSGGVVYFYDLVAQGWRNYPGNGTYVAASNSALYVVTSSGNIWSSPIALSTPGSTPTPVPGNGTPLAGPTYGPSAYGSAWGPTALANALNFPVQSGYNGNGSTVAIVIDSNVSASDISAYNTYFLTPSTSRTIGYELIDGASSTPSGGGQTEATLDTETVAGLAPGANINIYVIPDLSDAHIWDAYNQIITDGRAKVVSSSFGGCEAGITGGQSAVFQAGVNAGITFVASAGDNGNDCQTGPNTVGAQYPASDPNVIGVGGTETFRTGYTLTSPTAWNDTNCGSGVQCATGGGVSTLFSLPSYQSGLAGVASTSYRNVPDVAMPGEFDAVYVSGAWTVLSGTSWSAPAFAAMLSEVYEYCNASFTNPVAAPYYVYSADHSAFIDVVNGNNQYASTTPYYSAHSGYDNVSGVGVPYGMPFAQTACPSRVPASKVRIGTSSTAALVHSTEQRAIDIAPRVGGLVDLGRRPAGAQTSIQLILQPSGSLAQSESSVIAVLQAAGFTITRTFSNHLIVDATGPSSSVESLFATQMDNVSQSAYGVRYAPVGSATLPASLAPYVAGVTLDNVVTYKRGTIVRR